MIFYERTYGGSDLADMNSEGSAHAATIKIPINGLQGDQVKLKRNTSAGWKKALSTTVAARFLQVERQLQLVMDLGSPRYRS